MSFLLFGASFQFQDGAIKGELGNIKIKWISEFQFQDGAIKGA